MVKPQDKVSFVDDMGKSFTGIVVKVNSPENLNIKVRRKMGFQPQVFVNVPRQNKKKDNKPCYVELSTKKQTFNKKD